MPGTRKNGPRPPDGVDGPTVRLTGAVIDDDSDDESDDDGDDNSDDGSDDGSDADASSCGKRRRAGRRAAAAAENAEARAAQRRREDLVLGQIRGQLMKGSRAELSFGMVWIEPIIAHTVPIMGYTGRFLRALRELCDWVQVPLLCDETLTCGGRTGLPAGYMHFSRFEPDYFVFGKAMGLAGIAAVHRPRRKYALEDATFTSMLCFPAQMLASMRALERMAMPGYLENISERGREVGC
jgi:adenosylmethionine-8-amino-7-oxononanoate aminotransferase